MAQRPRPGKAVALALVLSLLANLAGHAVLGAVVGQAPSAEAAKASGIVICTPSGLKHIDPGPPNGDSPAQERAQETRFCFFCKVMPDACARPASYGPLILRANVALDLRSAPVVHREPWVFVQPPARAPPRGPVFRL